MLIAESSLTKACGKDPSWLCREVLSATDNRTLATVADFIIDRPIKIALILLLALVVHKLGRRLIKRTLRRLGSDGVKDRLTAVRKLTPDALLETSKIDVRSSQRTEALVTVLSSIYSAIVWIVALVFIVEEIGVNLAPLLAGAGLIGIALGFGAQSLIKDFVSGFFILVEDQFGVGDFVNIDGTEGQVETITLRTTRIRSLNGTVWYIPNGELRKIGNLSQHFSRALLDVQISYRDSVTEAKDAVKRVADRLWEADSRIVSEPEVWGVQTLGSDGLTIRLVVKTEPAKQWDVERELRELIKAEFDRVGIEIPYRQQTLWVHQQGS